MDLREIEIFLTLAEELHFGRTAQRLYLSQSRVSQTIQVLENRVGGQLFERTSRRVRLTPVGEQFRDLIRPAYDGVQDALRAVRSSTSGIAGELQIGVGTLPVLGTSFSEIIAGFEADHPACRVIIREMPIIDAVASMRGGAVDLVATWLPLAQPDITIGPVLSRQERVLAVQVGHPLAERGYADVEDLADKIIPDASGALPEETLDVFHPRRTPSGRPIIRRHVVRQTNELFHLVSSGAVVHPTVTLVPDYYRHPRVCFIPLRGLPPMVSALVWPTGRQTPAVLAFAEMARRFEPH